jgi:hypothetical protein
VQIYDEVLQLPLNKKLLFASKRFEAICENYWSGCTHLIHHLA